MPTSTPMPGNPHEYTRIVSLAVHEMRTPASVVGGYLRMLLNDTSMPLEARQRHMLEEAEKACGRLVGLLSELSDLAKLDAGTAKLGHDRIDLFEMLHEIGKDRHEQDDREVRLTIRGPRSGGIVEGDRPRLRATLDILVRAVMREQPAATLVVAEGSRTMEDGRPVARIVVAPEPDLARASTTVDGPLDDQRGGLGLGLPMARRVVGRMGGRLWSATPDAGVELPLGSRGAIVAALPLTE